jgi:hypothetical protein
LFRARDLDAGVDHVRRRASYAGGSGTLVAADARGEARVLRFASGALEVEPAHALARAARARQVELDSKLCRLEFFGRDGACEAVRLDASPR